LNADKSVELVHEIPRSYFHPVEAGIRANEFQNLPFPNRTYSVEFKFLHPMDAFTYRCGDSTFTPKSSDFPFNYLLGLKDEHYQPGYSTPLLNESSKGFELPV
jgi:hypothetical protein